MTQAKPNTFDALTQEAIDFDVSEGHISADAPVWGRYQGLTRAILLALRALPEEPGPRYTAGEYSRRNVEAMIDDVLRR